MSLRRVTAMLVAAALLLLAPGALAAGPYPPPSASGAGHVSQSRVEAGGCVTFSGTGFRPFADVTIRDSADPTFVGHATAGADGSFSYKVCFSADASRGRHHLTGTGDALGGGKLTVSVDVYVTGVSEEPAGAGAGGGLPFTGFAAALVTLVGIALLGVGSGLLLIADRRQRTRRRTNARAAA